MPPVLGAFALPYSTLFLLVIFPAAKPLLIN
jgi:hypothetical protein